MLELRIDFHVWYVDGCSFEDCPRRPTRPMWARWVDAMELFESLGGEVVMRDDME